MNEQNQQYCYSGDSDFWNTFYKQKKTSISKESLFARFVQKYVQSGKTLVDIGCGNGRDSIYFNNHGLNVIGIDGSTAAFKLLQNKQTESLSFILGNFINDSRIFDTPIDYYYSRFTLHTINEASEDILLTNIFNNLQKGGFFFLEVRSINDEKFGQGIQVARNTFILDGHHRRFLVMNELLKKLIKLNFSIKYAEEEKGFAPFVNEDSPIIRIIAQKA